MSEALYLYCVANGREKTIIGKIGIDENEVYTIPYKDLCAIVHNCTPEPYKSEDDEKVKVWILAHEKVVETSWERCGTVLPLGFDTIIKGDQEGNAEKNLKKWLEEDYKYLKQKIGKLKNKAEYGIQIFWDPWLIGKNISERNPEIRKLKEDVESKSKGTAYMYRQRLENILKKEIEKEADKYFKLFYRRIKECVDNIKIDKVKKCEEGRQMLINLSCLLPKKRSKVLGEELEKISNREGFFVHFTGPWPPYSFV